MAAVIIIIEPVTYIQYEHGGCDGADWLAGLPMLGPCRYLTYLTLPTLVLFALRDGIRE